MVDQKLADVGTPSKRPMDLALAKAEAAGAAGEVPVGAVVVSSEGEVLAAAGNRTLAARDPTAHAELIAIREACAKLGSERLSGCDLYVTL
jgi:tRNA(adenine34) deaminase